MVKYIPFLRSSSMKKFSTNRLGVLPPSYLDYATGEKMGIIVSCKRGVMPPPSWPPLISATTVRMLQGKYPNLNMGRTLFYDMYETV